MRRVVSSSQSADGRRTAAPSRGRVLVLVQNQPLPLDLRVWAECLSLREQGFEVVGVCPATSEYPEPFAEVDGIEIHRFAMRPGQAGAAGYIREYAQSFWNVARTVRRLARGRRFDVVHAANPPDILLLAALPLKARGARFIFDHHDLVPELFLTRFGGRRGLIYAITRITERLSFALADMVISTNESYRRIAIDRGGKRPDQVFVVRNGPNLARFASGQPDQSLRRGKPHLLLYLGVMGPQDGVDHALRALALLKRRRQDWHAAIVGSGQSEPELRRLAAELGLDDQVEFPGWLEGDAVLRYLFTADVGLAPDPKNPLADRSTLVKIAEYMAAGCPVVSYDLAESRVSARDAALYATPNEPQSFADCIATLLDDPALRERMGAAGRSRARDELAWEHSAEHLAEAYRWLLDGGSAADSS
jgi:glycosyltransferase involved in cell wall biosynthesis